MSTHGTEAGHVLKRRVHYSQTFLEFSQFSIAIKIEEGTLKKIKKEKKKP